MIGRKDQLDARVLRLAFDLKRLRHHFVLDKRLPDRETLRFEKRVGHRTADQKLVDLALDQRFDHRDLVGNLRAAEYGDKRPFGFVQSLTKKLQLFLHQQAGDACLDMVVMPSVDACAR
jgi:hypothetical protein